MIQIEDKKKCCGCTACKNKCPKNAITMKPDEEGFLYPYVDLDKCIDCGLCEKVCPIINNPKLPERSIAGYVVQNQNPQVLKESTSGGFVDAVNEWVIKQNGLACGVVFDENFMPTHVMIGKIEDLPAFRGSKYAQSKMGSLYAKIEQTLKRQITVVFTGTPCQAAGLKQYLRKEYENLVIIDIVCRSIPSPLLWNKYLRYQEKKFSSKIKKVNCRNKTYGYHSGSLVIEFVNGKRYSGSNRVDLYMKSFHHDICSRPSCYDCRFKTKTRCSDFTVFDCWEPEKVCLEKMTDDNRGYSNVIVHTGKGMKIIEQLDCLVKHDASIEKMFMFTGRMESHSISKTEVRDQFYNRLVQEGFESAVESSVEISLKDRIIEMMKPIRYYKTRRLWSESDE